MKQTELEARHAKRLLPWHKKAVALVGGKIADAASHARNAVTESLKATPDGRTSLAVVRRNPSYLAALARLDELWTAIGGPSVTSLEGLVQDCTVAAYVDSFGYWRLEIPREYQVTSHDFMVPSQAQKTYVRGLLWFGQPIRAEFEPAFKRAKVTLGSSIHAAGSIDQDVAAIRTWETRQRARLIQMLGNALNDANQRADSQAMKDVTDPKYLTEEAKHAVQK